MTPTGKIEPSNEKTLRIGPIEISCAHFVHTSHPTSPCRRLHGHNYSIYIEITGSTQPDGMIIDARDIKNLVNDLDHRTLLPRSLVSYNQDNYIININDKNYLLPKEDCYIMIEESTTAELIADHLKRRIQTAYFMLTNITVVVQETSKMSVIS